MCLSPYNTHPTSNSILLSSPQVLYFFLTPTHPLDFSFDIIFPQGHPYYTPLQSRFGAFDLRSHNLLHFPCSKLDHAVGVVAVYLSPPLEYKLHRTETTAVFSCFILSAETNAFMLCKILVK